MIDDEVGEKEATAHELENLRVAALDRHLFDSGTAAGWRDVLVLSTAEFKCVARFWHEFGAPRRKDKENTNPEVTIENKFKELLQGNDILTQMNQGAQPGSYRLTRSGLCDYLRAIGVQVDSATPQPYYEHV